MSNPLYEYTSGDQGYEVPDNSTVTNDHYAAPADQDEAPNMYNHLSKPASTAPLFSVVTQPECDRLTPAGQRAENVENYVVSVTQVRSSGCARVCLR